MAANLSALRVLNPTFEPDFGDALHREGIHSLTRRELTTLQVNVGRLCNQACHHCHVEAGPRRMEIMSPDVADRILALLAQTSSIRTVDITGGAPELNPNFSRLVLLARSLGRQVIDRCNLTVLFEPGQQDLAIFLADNQVEVVASLPCYTESNVDQQRGRGVFEKSIAALKVLNTLGYGDPASGLVLNLVYNPLGASLPPPQDVLEADYKKNLRDSFGIIFNRLLTITNMPIKRFADSLARSGKWNDYMGLLVNHFNPATVPHLMCRSMISVSWQGNIYDCDFNQMLDLKTFGQETIWDVNDFSVFENSRIATGSHCFGCTAGAGSSCGGSLQ